MKIDDQIVIKKTNPQKVLQEGDEIFKTNKKLGDAPVNNLYHHQSKLNIERRVCSLLLSQILNQEIKLNKPFIIYSIHPEDLL